MELAINSQIVLPCGAVIKNRIAKSAMSENMAEANHEAGKSFSHLYARWAKGGAGLVITGNVMIDLSQLGEPNNVCIEKGHKGLEGLKAWADAGTQNKTHLWMQINHPGKQTPSFLTKEPVAPSAIGYQTKLKKMFNTPRKLSEPEIKDIIQRFGFAAKTAKEAGFTGVQIHAAHGYLITQFLSPLHNQRKDQWGGSLENRMRFVVEVYKEIRSQVGLDFPVGIKLNSADFMKGGFTEDESLVVAKKLCHLGVDLIEISGGTYESAVMMSGQKESTKKREAYFLDFCEKVRVEVSVPILLTGGFRTREGMKRALESKACDMIGLARSVAIDPEFPNKILSGSDAKSDVRPLTTGFKGLDSTFPLEIIWYTHQLHRMGRGKEPKAKASVMLSVVKSVIEMGVGSVKRVRS